MPSRKKNLLPSRRGFCVHCRKDIYDEISAQLALEFFSLHPHRGKLEPVRFYDCPVGQGKHLTSKEARSEYREIQHSSMG